MSEEKKYREALEFIANLYNEGDDDDYEVFKYHIAIEHAERVLGWDEKTETKEGSG